MGFDMASVKPGLAIGVLAILAGCAKPIERTPRQADSAIASATDLFSEVCVSSVYVPAVTGLRAFETFYGRVPRVLFYNSDEGFSVPDFRSGISMNIHYTDQKKGKVAETCEVSVAAVSRPAYENAIRAAVAEAGYKLSNPLPHTLKLGEKTTDSVRQTLSPIPVALDFHESMNDQGDRLIVAMLSWAH